MPDFYAHQVFGDLVFSALPGPVRAKLEPERAGWQCGLYGPDPLFFYRLSSSDPVNREGHRLHQLPPRQVLERYRGALHTPCALGYAAGFLCHYVLDAACHPVVNRHAGDSSMKHAFLEGALDRSLAPPGRAGLPARFAPDCPAYAAAALGYEQAGPEEYRKALANFCRVSRLAARMRQLTPRRRRNPAAVAELRRAMEEAVPRCAGLVCQLVEGLEDGAALDFLPQTDFSGQDVAAVPV